MALPEQQSQSKLLCGGCFLFWLCHDIVSPKTFFLAETRG